MRVVADTRDKLQRALDIKFGYRPDKDKRISEGERRKYLRPEQLCSMQELFTLIKENTTADIPKMLGTSLNRAMVTFYKTKDNRKWEGFTKVGSLKDFKEQERIIFGEFAGVPKRNEGASYVNLGFPPEFSSKFTPDTRGGTIKLTRRMLKNDDLGALSAIPEKAAAGAWESFKKFVYGLATGNSTGNGPNTYAMYDSLSLFHNSHGNLGTLPLDVTSLLACRARMYNQWLPGQQTVLDHVGGIDDAATTIGLASVEGFFPGAIIRIGTELIKVGSVDLALVQLTGCTREMYQTTAASHANGATVQIQARPVDPVTMSLIVPRNLESKAFETLASEKVPGGDFNNRNFLNQEYEEGRIEIITEHPTYLGDDEASWYLYADPSSVPTVCVDFMDGRREPEVILQDQSTAHNVFDADEITYKIRHEYGGVNADWRGAQGNLVPPS